MKYITVHCSATRPNDNYTVEKLRHTHVDVNGWSAIGYHFYITRDGERHDCRPLTRTGAHVYGYNTDNIGVCMEGGLNQQTGKPEDNYTEAQWNELFYIIGTLQERFNIPNDRVLGHCDWPGVTKACPCFDVQQRIFKK